jgi:outer membrane protein
MEVTLKNFHTIKSKGRIKACALCILLPIALAVGFPATASHLTAAQKADYEQAEERERIRLLIALAKSGQQDLASELIDLYPLQGKHASNRTLFINGLIKKSSGDLTGATKDFRAALASDPSLTLVRSELAETLVALEEDDSAKHHLKLLQAAAPDQATAAQIGSFIDQIDARRPYTFNAYMAVAPTTNVNNGSIRKTVYSPLFGEMVINDQSKRKSGLGVAIGTNGSYSHRLGNDLRAVISGGIDGRIYEDEDFNAVTLSQAAELRYMLDRGYISFGAVGSQSLDTNSIEPGYYSYGPRIAARLGLTNKDTLALGATFEFREYVGSRDQDGTALMLDASWQHAIDSTFVATLSAGFDDVDAENDVLSYQSVSAGLGIYKELPAGVTINLNGEIKSTKFEDPMLLVGVLREDMRMTARTGVTKRDWGFLGFAPSLEYTYTWNDSNIALYDFDSHSIDLRLTKEF